MAPLVALPPEIVTGDPKLVPSIANCTVPLGVPVPGAVALTAAVNVTDWPNTEGLLEELTDVVVLARLTVCDRADDVLRLRLVSPG